MEVTGQNDKKDRSYDHGKKMDGTPDAIYYNYPYAYHQNKNGAWHSIESRGFPFYHNPSPLTLIYVKGSSKPSDNMTWINIVLGGGESLFSPKSDKVCQHFFSWL